MLISQAKNINLALASSANNGYCLGFFAYFMS